MSNHPPEEASSHVLDKAEELFLEKGYAQTKLRDLAASLNMKPASLYYHAPGGKEELWNRVIDRAMKRHKAELTRAAAQAGTDLRSQLRAMGDWLISQPPVNIVSLASANVNIAESEQFTVIAEQLYEGLMAPVASVVRQAIDRNEIKKVEPDLVAGALVTSINGMLPLAKNSQLPTTLQVLVYQLIDIFMDGLNK